MCPHPVPREGVLLQQFVATLCTVRDYSHTEDGDFRFEKFTFIGKLVLRWYTSKLPEVCSWFSAGDIKGSTQHIVLTASFAIITVIHAITRYGR